MRGKMRSAQIPVRGFAGLRSSFAEQPAKLQRRLLERERRWRSSRSRGFNRRAKPPQLALKPGEWILDVERPIEVEGK
jgi:hypothetical protein